MNRAAASFTTMRAEDRITDAFGGDGCLTNTERYPMTDSPAETTQTREGNSSRGRRRHHALDAFQTSGSSPPVTRGRSRLTAAKAGWGSSWSR